MAATTRLVSLLAALGALLAVVGPATAGELAGPYTSPDYLTHLPFGARSDYLQPWRAYLETVPAERFLEGVGMNLNINKTQNAGLVVQMLAKNGVRDGRIEIGWAQVSYDDERRLQGMEHTTALLQACRQWGVRPLILLNAHQGVPGPVKFFQRTVIAAADAGARQVQLDDTGGLVLGRSGLSDLTGYWAAEALVVGVEGQTVTLSKPLPKALTAGQKVKMATLKYRPFSDPATADGQETLAGWQRYVGTVADYVTGALGSGGAADKGFDLEVWNELTFGTDFLFLNRYYDPPLEKYNERSEWGKIVQATADYADQHRDRFSGVRISDGFANTIPWPASSQEPDRISAISKHPYAGRRQIAPDQVKGTTLNAQGQRDPYVLAYTEVFPEYFASGIQTETMCRDLGPITTEIYRVAHGRLVRPDRPCGVWITEVAYGPNEDGVQDRATALALKAKAVARYLVFYLNKGVERLDFYAATGGDLGLGLVQDNFLEYSGTHTDYPADDAAYTSPALLVARRITAQMKEGLDPALTQTRALTVESLSDTHDHYQFPGDGTAAHPPLYDREVFAFLPYQVNAHRFVIPYYVVTRDLRASLAPEDFTLTIAGLRGAGAQVSAYDPSNDRLVPVKLGAATADHLSLTVTAADYPYLLTVDEGAGQ